MDPSRIVGRVSRYTMTEACSIVEHAEQVRRIVERGISGSFVECGVWKGGSMMAVALALLDLGVTDRDLYLFDTFTGMTIPGDMDVDHMGNPALPRYLGTKDWCAIPLDEVAINMQSTGYPMNRVFFVKGPVEETLPGKLPSEVALAHLDTDWYGSTKHELTHIFPRLHKEGVVIVDDYGHWKGARKAVDEAIMTYLPPVTKTSCGYTAVVLSLV